MRITLLAVVAVPFLWLCSMAPELYGGNNLLDNPNQVIWKFSPGMWDGTLEGANVQVSKGSAKEVGRRPGPIFPYISWGRPLAGKPVQATIIAPHRSYRDVVELCERLSLAVTSIQTSSFTEAASSCIFDQYPNLGAKPEEWLDLIRRELQKPADAIVIGKVQWRCFPADIRKTIVEKVRAGAGMLYMNPELARRESKAERQGGGAGGVIVLLPVGELDAKTGAPAQGGEVVSVSLEPVDASHPSVRNLTGLRLPQLEGKEWTSIVFAGELGKGRVLAVDWPFRIEHGVGPRTTNEESRAAMYSSGAWGLFKHSLVGASHETELPCAYEYLMSFVAKATLWCARREPECCFERIELSGDRELLVARSEPAQKLSVWAEIRDAKGLTGTAIQVWKPAPQKLRLPVLPGGTYFINARLTDGRSVYDWGTVRYDVPVSSGAPKLLREIRLREVAPLAGRPIVGEVVAEDGWSKDDVLRLSLVDTFGRCLWRTAPTGERLSKSVPFRAEFDPGRSNAVVLQAERIRGGEVMEQLEKTVCLARRELDGDFAFIGWTDFIYNNRVMRQDMEICRRLGMDAAMHVGPSLREECVRSNMRLAHYVLRVTNVQVRGFSHPSNLETWQRLFRRAGQEMAPFAPLTMTFGDETCFGWPDDGTAVTSYLTPPYSDQTFRLFLGWLFDKQWGHLDLAAINKAWGTSFKSEDEIKVLPIEELRRTNSRGQWVAEAMWADWLFQRLLRESAESGRSEIPYAYYGDEGVGNMYSGEGHDYYLLQKDMDICQLYDYMQGPFFVKSFARPDSLRGMWTGNYGYYNGEVDEEWMRSRPWRSLFYGMNSEWWWMTSLSIRSDGRPIPCFAAYAEEIRKIRSGPATLLLKVATPYPPQVGVLYSPNTVHVHTFEQNTAGPHRFDLSVACQGLIRAGYSFKVLHPSQLDDPSELGSGYKALVLPAVLALSETQVATIREFVKSGGLLIAGRAPDQYFSEFGIPYDKDPFRSVFKAGATPEEYTYGQGRALFLKDPFGLSPLERYKNVLGQTYTEKHNQTLAEMFRHFIEGQAACKPPVSFTLPDGRILSDGEISTFADGPTLYIGIDRNGRYWEGEQLKWLKWDDYEEEVETTLTLPRASYVYDVTRGEYLGYGKSIKTKLTSYPRLFAALPVKAGAPKLEFVSAKCCRGKSLSATVFADKAFAAVLHVSVRNAKDEVLPWFERNVIVSDGSARFELPIALDEEPGRYLLTVRDTVSGGTDSGVFRIE